LGNQVFQYVFLRRYFKDAVIWASGMGSLPQVFEPDPRLRTEVFGRRAERWMRRVVTPLFLKPLFKWLRVGGYCVETLVFSGSVSFPGPVMSRKGVLPLTLVDRSYFQNLDSLLEPADFRCLRVRPDVLAQAMASLNATLQGGQIPEIVMHVRRGDYLYYRQYGLDVVLSAEYFCRAAAAGRAFVGADSPLLIVTDDPAWCQRELTDIQPFTVMSSSEAADFALLTMFPVAILSNSSFSLAAACIGPGVQRVIGPQFWFGHSVGLWYPPCIRSRDDRFVYV
jgi:hypothetical protein